MESKDLTNECGFQAHQMAIRYYVMHTQLQSVKEIIGDYNTFFYDFNESLKIITDKGSLHNNDKQKLKAHAFTDQAIESPHKQFNSWCSVKLLPAALMSETKLAKSVSRVIAGDERITYPVKPSKEGLSEDEHHVSVTAHNKITRFHSKVHKTAIYLPEFDAFIDAQHKRAIVVAAAKAASKKKEDDDGDVTL